MKLHLPKSLFIAVLAACGAVTTAWGKGDIIKYTAGSSAAFHEGTFQNETTGQSAGWGNFCNGNGSYNGGDTLKLSGAGAELNYSFSPLSYNALIVEVGATGYVINPSTNGRPLQIGRDLESHTSTINESVSVSSGSNATTTISGTQTWLVAENKRYTLGGGNVINNSALTIGGENYNGTVSFSGKTITGSGSILVSNGTLADAVFGTGGTLSVKEATTASAYSNVTMNAGSVIDLSSANLSADTALVDTEHLNIANGVHVKLGKVSMGDTLALFDSEVDVAVFYIDGAKVVEARSDISQENGVFTFNSLGGNLADMVWAGGASGTWNSTAEVWQSASVSGNLAFVNGDTVNFNSSTQVDIAEAVTVAGVTISGDATTVVKFTRSNSGYVAGNVEVTGGAKLIIGTETGGQGLVQGNITVTNGTLQFDARDATGYNGGVTSTQNITIASGSSLYLNHNSNETFAGTLVLNGSLSGKSASSMWDFYGGSAKVQVDAGNHASITAHTRIRHSNSDHALTAEIGEGASLTLAKVSGGNEAYKNLKKTGSGQLIFAGNTTAEIGTLHSTGGSIKVGNSSTDTSRLTVARIELGDIPSGSADSLTVSEGSLLKITGSTNQDGNMKSASIILGEWTVVTTLNLDGNMFAKDAYVLPGISGGIININGTGTLAVAGISKNTGRNDSGKMDVTLNDGGKLILGSGGIDSNLPNGTITLKNGTVATYADSMTIARDVTLSGTTGTTFDTEKYGFAADGNSISKIADTTGATITVSGVISGEGKLIKDGQGNLVLSAKNTYKGGTKVEAGTLIVSQGGSLGSGDIDVTGGELQVSGANAITATNLNISNGTVTANYSANGTDAVISHGTTVNIGAGGTLKLTGHDSMGWNGDSRADIILQGGDSNTIAKLDIQDYSGQEEAVCTFSNGIVMKGHAEITGTAFSTYGIEDDIPNGADDPVQGSRITVEGKNNKITTERLEIRRALELAIAKEAVLTIDSVLFFNGGNDQTADRRITKSGEGTLVITNSANTWNKKLHVTGGTLRLEGLASMPGSVTMASGTRLEAGTGTIGSLDMAGGSTLDADATVSVSGALTLGTGIKLEGDIVNALYSGEKNVTLFTGITSLSMGGTTYDPSARVAYTPVDITRIFNIENMEEGRYNLYYEGGELIAGLTAAVPEPATATLSLLALAGLCARRRRKA